MVRPRKPTLIVLLLAFLGGVIALPLYIATTTAGPAVSMTVETDKDSYMIGEEVAVTLHFVNDGDTEITFPTLSYRLGIEGPSGIVLLMKMKELRKGEVAIPPFSVVLIDSYIWSQKDYDYTQVEPGQYTMRGSLFDYVLEGETTFEIG